MAEQYTYAVARIRAKEMELLTKQDMEQLMSAAGFEEAAQMLADKGYGNVGTIDDMLHTRRDALWRLIDELTEHDPVLDLFRAEADFHNLKAVLKTQVSNTPTEGLFVEHGIISAQALEKMIEERSYEELPPHLSGIAKPALDVLLQTRDGQECDMMLDRAAMETVYEAGKRSDMFFLSEYIEKRAALMNIKIAVRCCLTQKPLSFIKRALGPCETLDTDALALAASRDLDAVYDVLMFTSYRDAVEVLKQSLSAFETWSDNQLMAFTKSQKSNPFTLAPLIAYMLAVETEMKVVRLILTGKLNHLEEQVIRERMRELYG